jgi:beta-galactosidase
VELFLNGESIGRQRPDKDAYSNNLPHPPFTFAVGYVAGKLEAVGYIGGVKQAGMVRMTPGKAMALIISVDESGKAYPQDNDVFLVYAKVVDKNKTIMPDAINEVKFSVTGNLEILGNSIVKCEAGIAAVLIRTKVGGGGCISVSADNLESPPSQCFYTTGSVKQ